MLLGCLAPTTNCLRSYHRDEPTMPRSIQTLLASWYENGPMVSFLERIRQDLHFKRWYFGHYHVDKQFNDQFVALYNRVIPISDMQMWRNR